MPRPTLATSLRRRRTPQDSRRRKLLDDDKDCSTTDIARLTPKQNGGVIRWDPLTKVRGRKPLQCYTRDVCWHAPLTSTCARHGGIIGDGMAVNVVRLF